MEILRVEPTPSPNTMKIVLTEFREDNKSNTYNTIKEGQPQYINELLALDGVKSIFHVMDFLAVDKAPKFEWEDVLPDVTAIINEDDNGSKQQPVPDDSFGAVKAEALMFKGIPYQVKLTTDHEEKRKQLPEMYIDAMLAAQKDTDNVVFLRKWIDLGLRYGEMEDVMDDVHEELQALYPKTHLARLVEEAQQSDVIMQEKTYTRVSLETYKETDDWKARLRLLDQFPTPSSEDFPLLSYALKEEKVPLRRQAIVLLGMMDTEDVLPYLYEGLRDKSPAVRRTTGDTISDLGYKSALPEMAKLLDDPQKIVRWRAAMFIFDEGGHEQLAALKAHADDPAYEVRLQIEMAITRIENGDDALGSVWKQIANRNK